MAQYASLLVELGTYFSKESSVALLQDLFSDRSRQEISLTHYDNSRTRWAIVISRTLDMTITVVSRRAPNYKRKDLFLRLPVN